MPVLVGRKGALPIDIVRFACHCEPPFHELPNGTFGRPTKPPMALNNLGDALLVYIPLNKLCTDQDESKYTRN